MATMLERSKRTASGIDRTVTTAQPSAAHRYRCCLNLRRSDASGRPQARGDGDRLDAVAWGGARIPADLDQVDIWRQQRQSLAARALPGQKTARGVAADDELGQIMLARVSHDAFGDLGAGNDR